MKNEIKQFCQMFEGVDDNKGYVFDFDDTLTKSPFKIYVSKDGQRIKSLASNLFNTYKLKDGESFDFADFDHPSFLRQVKKMKIWNVLQNVETSLGTGHTDSQMYVLTARSSDIQNALHEFLYSNGIRSIKKENIFTIGDNKDIPLDKRDTRSLGVRKKEVLQQIRDKHEGEVIFFDDDKMNIDLALEVPGIKTRLVTEELEESILDEPRKTMDPKIWDLQSRGLTLKNSAHDAVLEGVKTLVGDVPVKGVYIVGSLTGTRYNPDADLDVNIMVDTDKQTHKHIGRRAFKWINGKNVPDTEHPINYFVVNLRNGDPGLDRFDSAYDFQNDKWLKDPQDHGVDLFHFYDDFRQFVKDIDVEKDEALRSLIDIEILLSAMQTGGDPKIIFEKILRKFKALDFSVQELAKGYKDTQQKRIQSFLDYEQGHKRNLPSPNLLPENIRYKLLERYHYLDFMHKMFELVRSTGEIDNMEDYEDVRKILSEGTNYKKGKTFFEVSLKRWNDKAIGKVKSGIQPIKEKKINESLVTKVKLKSDTNNKAPQENSICDPQIDEDIDYHSLQSTGNLQEYFVALEGIMNKFEVTGGKIKNIKTSGQAGHRVDRGSKGALKSRRMGIRESMRRKRGAVKSNIKTKSRGKLSQANQKKQINQKMNPNAPGKNRR